MSRYSVLLKDERDYNVCKYNNFDMIAGRYVWEIKKGLSKIENGK